MTNRAVHDSPLLGPEPSRIADLLGQGRVREAVDAARDLAKKSPGAASDDLLVRAYTARIGQLRAEGLDRDARSLCDLVERRVPAAREQMAALREEGDLVADGFRGLLAALDAAEEDERKRFVALLARKLTDPGTLAASPALAAGHPLKAEAEAVRDVFAAVTRGPLPDGAMAALDVVSRSSPLAPWKLLIRAIDALSRNDSESVRRNVAALPPESAVAPLGPLLLRLSGSTDAAPALPAPIAALGERLTGGRATLRASLEELENALTKEDEVRATRAAERILSAIPPSATGTRTRFLLTLVSRWIQAGLSPEALSRDLIRGRSKPESLRHVALALEHFDRRAAVEAWEGFLEARQYLQPTASGAEIAAIRRHMAALVPPDEDEFLDALLAFDDDGDFDDDLDYHCPDCLREASLRRKSRRVFDRGALLEKAVAADGSQKSFRALLSHQVAQESKTAVGTATRWLEAWPGDSEPLVFLVEEAESRRDWKTALALLERADAEKHLSPQLRGRRFFALVGQVEDRIRKGQVAAALSGLKLAEKEPQATDGELGPYLTALEWALTQAGRKPDPAATTAVAARLEAEVKNPAFSWILEASAAAFLKREPGIAARAFSPVQALAALVRAQRLLPRLSRRLRVSDDIVQAAGRHLSNATPEELLTVCAGPAADAWSELAYAASTLGLALDGPLLARFLVARARALTARGDVDAVVRTVQLLRAAQALAGTTRDSEALQSVSVALKLLRRKPMARLALDSLGHWGEDLPDASAIQEILAAERLLPGYFDSPPRPAKAKERRPPRPPARRRPKSPWSNLPLDFGDDR